MSDNVHNPAHYTAGGIETIDFIRAKLGPDGFRAYCLGNVIKYVTRHGLKNGDEDLSKAAVYLDWARHWPEKPAEPRTVEAPVYNGIYEAAASIKAFDPPESFKRAMAIEFAKAGEFDEEPPLRSVMGDKL